jgi:hypothetical protein
MLNHVEDFDALAQSALALKLPPRFLVGAATCAYQIEGAPTGRERASGIASQKSPA